MRRKRLTVWATWIICALICCLSIYDAGTALASRESNMGFLEILDGMLIKLFPILFSIPAALIITRQPRNTIGWLMMTPALVGAVGAVINRYLDTFQTAPPSVNQFALFSMLFISGSGWIGLIFPLLLIPLFFPTGRLLSPRWRWTVILAGILVAFFLFWGTFTQVYQPENAAWTVTNPIGFISDEFANTYIFPPWVLMLSVLTAASLISIMMRYRRAAVVERAQIKWLLYSCVLFALIYIPSLIYNTELLPNPYRDLTDLLFLLAITTIPLAVAVAVLRYRLFDIDVIIRLTLVYTLVTGLLGLAYVGGVLLLQESLRAMTGQASQLVIVITTLLIALMFNPLRVRIQGWIDRRFYRKKYNAEQAVAEFAAAARDGTDLDALTAMLEDVVGSSLQPTVMCLYLLPYKEKGISINPAGETGSEIDTMVK